VKLVEAVPVVLETTTGTFTGPKVAFMMVGTVTRSCVLVWLEIDAGRLSIETVAPVKPNPVRVILSPDHPKPGEIELIVVDVGGGGGGGNGSWSASQTSAVLSSSHSGPAYADGVAMSETMASARIAIADASPATPRVES
jgi:hypothetical protein